VACYVPPEKLSTTAHSTMPSLVVSHQNSVLNEIIGGAVLFGKLLKFNNAFL